MLAMTRADEEDDLYGNLVKKIIFKDTTQRHVDLRLKLEYDEINQTKFFRACVTAYLEDNENMREIISTIQTHKTNKAKIKKQVIKATEQKKSYALDSSDIENIFDIIELEHPDL